MIKIIGNSNYKVSIINDKNDIFILKKSFSKNDSDRLKKQIQKQEYFLNHQNDFIMISIPKILTKYKDKYIIEYIYSYDIIQYLNIMNINHINKFININIQFIKTLLKNSNKIKINQQIIIEKINMIQNKLRSSLLLNNKNDNHKIILKSIQYLYDHINIFNNEIPINICHGDLTFSNMLINYDHKLYLIDFLDNFIESPIMDIIKLRQDTKYKYILQLYNHNYDKNRINILFNYMNTKIENEFQEYESYFEYLDLMNFLRILQYSKNEKITKYIIKNLNDKLLKTL